jgi:hypothetical protein
VREAGLEPGVAASAVYPSASFTDSQGTIGFFLCVPQGTREHVDVLHTVFPLKIS